MISRKQLSKNLYKLTKKEFPEIFGNETDDDDTEVDSLGWWSSIDEASEYCDSGENKRNALEYEKAYIALIEQVKDKTHDEKVTFLMSHMDELREMVDLFSYTDDDSEIRDDELIYQRQWQKYHVGDLLNNWKPKESLEWSIQKNMKYNLKKNEKLMKKLQWN